MRIHGQPVSLAGVEPLEPRRLLSGVTLITHGQGGDAGDEVAFIADLIAERAGGAAQYVMEVGGDGLGAEVVSFRQDPDSPALEEVASGERIIKIDWSDVKTRPTTIIADAVAEHMLNSRLVEQQLHLAGPSRGASVMSNLAAALGERGVWIDQVTYLDPVPANIPIPGLGNLVDGPMRVTENVLFADNYWRSDGNILTGFDGQPVDGAYNVELEMVEEDNFGDPHVGAGVYYIATVDPTEPIVPPAKESWFLGTREAPARDRTGYKFSRIGGGARPREGVSAGFDGIAPRDEVDREGSTVAEHRWAEGPRQPARFAVGERFTISYRFNDADSASNVAIVIDDDQNPYNRWAATLARRDYAAQDAPQIRRLRVGKPSLEPGAYFLAARIKDAAGHVRYAYAPYSIELTEPAQRRTAAMVAAPPTLVARRAELGSAFNRSNLVEPESLEELV